MLMLNLLTISEMLNISSERINDFTQSLIDGGTSLGKRILIALVIFFIGRYVINLLKKLTRTLLEKQQVDPTIRSFVTSLINTTLMILLLISVIGALGVQTTSIAALIASLGVGIGMALSGNLNNFAGGLVILLFKPFKVNSVIECQGVIGTVKEIQLFHTIINTFDNKVVFVPNGALSSGVITNYSNENTRRISWTFGVDYGTDIEKAKAIITRLLVDDKRVFTDPEPFLALTELADSSVKIVVRVWCKSDDYWNIYFDLNQKVYDTFNTEGVEFPFPQLTVHKAN